MKSFSCTHTFIVEGYPPIGGEFFFFSLSLFLKDNYIHFSSLRREEICKAAPPVCRRIKWIYYDFLFVSVRRPVNEFFVWLRKIRTKVGLNALFVCFRFNLTVGCILKTRSTGFFFFCIVYHKRKTPTPWTNERTKQKGVEGSYCSLLVFTAPGAGLCGRSWKFLWLFHVVFFSSLDSLWKLNESCRVRVVNDRALKKVIHKRTRSLSSFTHRLIESVSRRFFPTLSLKLLLACSFAASGRRGKEDVH